MKLLLVLLLLPAIAGATPLDAALNQSCPQKNLNRLTPGDLDFGLDNYLDALKPHIRAGLAHKMDAARAKACRQSMGGLACPNMAAVSVMTPLERNGFAHYLCRQAVSCAPGEACRLPGS